MRVWVCGVVLCLAAAPAIAGSLVHGGSFEPRSQDLMGRQPFLAPLDPSTLQDDSPAPALGLDDGQPPLGSLLADPGDTPPLAPSPAIPSPTAPRPAPGGSEDWLSGGVKVPGY